MLHAALIGLTIDSVVSRLAIVMTLGTGIESYAFLVASSSKSRRWISFLKCYVAGAGFGIGLDVCTLESLRAPELDDNLVLD